MSHFITELGRNSLQAAALVLVVALVQWTFGSRLQPRWRCALWVLVVVRLLVPFSLDSVTSLSNLPNLFLRLGTGLPNTSASSTSTYVATPATPTHPVATITEDFHQSRIPLEVISQPRLQGPALVAPIGSPNNKERGDDIGKGTDNNTQDLVPKAALQPGVLISLSHLPWPSLPTLLFWIWLSGTLILLGNIFIASVRMAIRSHFSEPVVDRVILALMEQCHEKLAVPRRLTRSGNLRIIETPEISSPALYGMINPCLLLPKDFTKNFSHQELEFVFLHELAHLKRHDLLMNWIMAFLQSAHWFNPFVWLAFARWRIDREHACDAMVLDAMGQSQNKEYGHTILRLLEEFNTSLGAPGMVGILEDNQQLRQRISMIAAYVPSRRSPLLAVVLITLLALVGLTDARSDNPASSPAPIPAAKHSESQLNLELKDGSRVHGSNIDDIIRFHSPSLGDFKLPIASIESITSLTDSNSNIFHLRATNGDELDVQFADPQIHIKTSYGESGVPVTLIRNVTLSSLEKPQLTKPLSSPNVVIQNPSFETPAITEGAAYMRFVTAPSNAGWTFVNSAAIGKNGCALNQYQSVGTTNGVQYACLQGINGIGASISQTLSNLPSGNYCFTFNASQRCTLGRYTDNTQNQTVSVLVDGTNVGNFTPPDQNWYPYETTPISLGEGSHTLTFTNLPVPGDASILLDEIGIKGINPSSVPVITQAIPPSAPLNKAPDFHLILELRDGSLILGKSLDQALKFHSASLGDLKLPVAGITTIKFSADSKNDTVHVSATNGDELDLVFATPDIVVQTSFGKSEVPVNLIKLIKVSQQQSSPESSTGLVSQWKADNNGNDSAGTNNAFLPTGITYALNKLGKGFNFDGNAQGLNIPASPSLDVGAGPGLTVSCWAQPISSTTRNPLLEWKEGTHLWISESGDAGVSKPGCVYANILDTSGNHHRFGSATGIVQLGVPQQFALTYDKSSGMGCLYYNGKLVASQYLGNFTPKTDTSLSIGERTVPEEVHYQGLINEASIYKRALSPQEIQSLYTAENIVVNTPQPVMKTAGLTVTIPANSANGYSLGSVRKGTKITFQYLSGLWKSWGHIATVSPDEENPAGGQICRVAIALPRSEDSLGDVIATLPAGTQFTPFVFEAQEDYPNLILRINSQAFNGPGEVVYKLNIEVPSGDKSEVITTDGTTSNAITPPSGTTAPPPSYFGSRLPPVEVK